MNASIPNFVVIDSIYGRLIINRHCDYQAEHLIKTGRPHIEGELRNMLMIVGTLPKDALIVDVGANAGLVSIPLARAVKDKGGAVHAFEVQRQLYNALCGSVALNDLDNLYVHLKAVGRTIGALRVPRLDYGKPQDFGLCTLTDQAMAGDGEIVPLVSLDTLALPRLDFLKIDVEGMEIEVLAGAAQTITTHRPWCWIEYWKVDIAAIKHAFADLGYCFFIMDKLNMLCAPSDRLSTSRLQVRASEA